MLNHIWLALIVIGILTAAGRDIYEVSRNSYGNGIPWMLQIETSEPIAVHGEAVEARLVIPRRQLRLHFHEAEANDAVIPARVTLTHATEGVAVLDLSGDVPERFRVMAKAQGGDGTLTARLRHTGAGWEAEFDPVSLVYLKNITNAAFEIAGVAVQIAIGLIGIMALWLGVMKVAEKAGLITKLSRLVRPVTVRLFPDVPADHPAVGSMIMNISANMLGLGNAATPFGLKAMEELDELNSKKGVATDSMVTFLALNTSCITLIPATAIAVRAAAGSSDPAIIIGTSFLASLTATIFAVTISKLLSRVKMFRWERSEAE
jgi:spore maturation protein A